MRTLIRRVKWAAVALGAGALAVWLFPVVATVLIVALYSSWAVIVVLLLRAVPVPERVRSGLPAMRGPRAAGRRRGPCMAGAGAGEVVAARGPSRAAGPVAAAGLDVAGPVPVVLSRGGAEMVTDHEMRAAQAKVGAAGVAVAAGSAALGATTMWPLLDSAALLGGAAWSVAAAGALAHHAWYFASTRVFRRQLGGPLGWLDGRDVKTAAGADAVRAQAAGLFRDRDPHRHPIHVSGWEVGRLVSGPAQLRRRRVYCPWTRGVGILGPQGSGKSQYLIRMVLDAPGAAVVSSTKPELAQATMALRARHGPAWVFNPQQLGHLASTLRWDPVAGCACDQTANSRAHALVRGSGAGKGTEHAQFWAQKAVEIIRCYLMAAALTGQGMDTVLSWANNPDDPTPLRYLDAHTGPDKPVPTAWVDTLRTHLAAAHNTRTGYFANVVSAVNFVDNPVLAAACRPDPGTGAGLDVEEFLASAGTLYLVGGDDPRVAPLFTALVEHLFDSAKRVAARAGGVLPTTCAFLLDEVATITPVPLDRWAADSRGWGITVCAVVQSLAQFATTWGPQAGEVIWQNLPTKVILPGVSDTDDLDDLAYLGGKRRIPQHTQAISATEDGHRTRSTSTTRAREPVVEGDVISRMPRWHAYVLGLGQHPAIVRYTPGYAVAARQRAALGITRGQDRDQARAEDNGADNDGAGSGP